MFFSLFIVASVVAIQAADQTHLRVVKSLKDAAFPFPNATDGEFPHLATTRGLYNKSKPDDYALFSSELYTSHSASKRFPGPNSTIEDFPFPNTTIGDFPFPNATISGEDTSLDLSCLSFRDIQSCSANVDALGAACSWCDCAAFSVDVCASSEVEVKIAQFCTCQSKNDQKLKPKKEGNGKTKKGKRNKKVKKQSKIVNKESLTKKGQAEKFAGFDLYDFFAMA